MAWNQLTAEERFWLRVTKSTGCWIWTGLSDKDGYGVLRQAKLEGQAKGSKIAAHRFSWQLHHGPVADLWVLHHCDNPPCVNPKHLYLGTPADNVHDAVERDRYLQTHCKWGHILTPANESINSHDGRRRCKECVNRRAREYTARHRDAINAKARAKRNGANKLPS